MIECDNEDCLNRNLNDTCKLKEIDKDLLGNCLSFRHIVTEKRCEIFLGFLSEKDATDCLKKINRKVGYGFQIRKL